MNRKSFPHQIGMTTGLPHPTKGIGGHGMNGIMFEEMRRWGLRPF